MKKKKSAGQDMGQAAGAKLQETNRAETRTMKSAKKEAPKGYVVIDYPMEGEILTSYTYSFRIGASFTDRVEVSIDDKEWQPCRENSGFWWFDWSGYSAGPHQVVARIPSGKRFIKSEPRHFTVLI